MNRVPRPRSDVCPVHARLLEQLAEVRRVAGAFARQANRYAYVRFESDENALLRHMQWALEQGEVLYGLAKSGHGRLVLDSWDGPDRFAHPVLILRPPPAKVVSLEAYRARRAG